MLRISPWLLLISLLPTLLLAKEKVAVIGAGPAGLKAAQRLLEEGYDVTVFEKEKRVGGKCKSIPESTGNGIMELGAVITTPNYNHVLKVVRDTGEKLRDHYPLYSFNYDEKEGHTYRLEAKERMPSDKNKETKIEEKKLKEAYKRFEKFDKNTLTGIPEDSEFNTDFENWCDRQGIKYYKEVFRFWFTSFGYGELKEIPAFFGLYVLSPIRSLVFITRHNQNMRMLVNGYGGLLEKMVEHYKIPVMTGVNINKITRTDDEVTVSYTTANEESKSMQDSKEINKIATFDRLVVACGFACMDGILADQTDAEREILDAIHYAPYDVVIASSSNVPRGGVLISKNFSRPGHIVLISKNAPGESEDMMLYLPRQGVTRRDGKFNRPTEDQLKTTALEDMKELGYKDVKIKTVESWDKYFPHFLEPKYFDKLEAIQGANRTVYVGPPATFEMVEKSMAHADDTVLKHIVKKPNFTPYKVTGLKWVKQFISWKYGAVPKHKVLKETKVITRN